MIEAALATPNVETFDLLLDVEKTFPPPPHPDFTEQLKGTLMIKACEGGAAEKVRRLIAFGSPVNDCRDWANRILQPIRAACTGEWDLHDEGRRPVNANAVVRVLLSHGASVEGDEVAIAARFGDLSLLRTLVEAGADVNAGHPKALVSAVALEREDIFKALLCWGARLDSETGAECVEKAMSGGLESMLSLLDQHGATVEYVKGRLRQSVHRMRKLCPSACFC